MMFAIERFHCESIPLKVKHVAYIRVEMQVEVGLSMKYDEADPPQKFEQPLHRDSSSTC